MESIQKLKQLCQQYNPQRIAVKTYSRGICTKCKVDCKKTYFTLEHEYNELGSIINNIQRYQKSVECFRHRESTYHPLYKCSYEKCEKCEDEEYSKISVTISYIFGTIFIYVDVHIEMGKERGKD